MLTFYTTYICNCKSIHCIYIFNCLQAYLKEKHLLLVVLTIFITFNYHILTGDFQIFKGIFVVYMYFLKYIKKIKYSSSGIVLLERLGMFTIAIYNKT